MTKTALVIALAAVMAAASLAGAAPRVVEVSTSEELIAAIASDTTIKLKPGTYELSSAVKGAVNEANGTSATDEYDGPQLVITGVRGLTIEGGDDKENYSIVTDPTYADVMELNDCERIKLSGLTMGHTETGDCSGSVLNFNSCKDIEIEFCDIYGSGVIGIEASGVQGLKVTDSTIRDCSGSLVSLGDVKGATFTTVSMIHRRDAYGAAIWLQGGEDGPGVEDVAFHWVRFDCDGRDIANEPRPIFSGSCGKGFMVKNCKSRRTNGDEVMYGADLDLGEDLRTEQIDGLGFDGEIVERER